MTANGCFFAPRVRSYGIFPPLHCRYVAKPPKSLSMSSPLLKIRPVGNPLTLSKRRFDPALLTPFTASFYHSGTAALAAAVIASLKRRADIRHPQVILPAYGCPDLVSAVLHAGARPVLVDLAASSTYLDLDRVREAISAQTVAIVAVRFLGIPERMADLAQICATHQLTLIEDSAQGFPVTEPATYWQGDYTVLSFGRGKPVNLLGGGAVLTREADMQRHLPAVNPADDSFAAAMRYRLKGLAYNRLIQPLAYGLVARAPGLKLGETIYKPLHAIRAMPGFIQARLPANITAYRQWPNTARRIHEVLKELDAPDVCDLPAAAGFDFTNPLLRYPLLAGSKAVRDALYAALEPYGASIMYKRPLNEIEGIESLLDNTGQWKNAGDFADRLLTLPTHAGVDDVLLARIVEVMRGVFAHCRSGL